MGLSLFVNENTGYEDVMFTWDNTYYQAPIFPLWTAYSMKIVYLAGCLEDIYQKVGALQGEYVVDLVYKPAAGVVHSADLDQLIARAYDHRVSSPVPSDQVRIDKIRKADFLALCRELGVPKRPAPPLLP
jgi:hypothetical protein